MYLVNRTAQQDASSFDEELMYLIRIHKRKTNVMHLI